MKVTKFTMVKAFSALLLVGISGCADVNGYNLIDNSYQVDCVSDYVMKLGSGSEPRHAEVKINRVRIDKNGNVMIKPQNTLDIKFHGGWQKSSLLTNYKCKGESYGLRGATIRR